jgi:glucose/arabinose dehydrogenase
VITFSVTASGEQGLLGIAIDPNFNANHYIYVFYTCACTPLENRVVRFEENNGIGSNPTTIFTSPNSTNASNHNGGNIHFAPDGKLYITLGDDGDTPSHSHQSRWHHPE